MLISVIEMRKGKFKLFVLSKLINTFYNPKVVFEDEDSLKCLNDEPCVIICNHTQRNRNNFLLPVDGPILRCVFKNQNVCSLIAKDIMDKPIIKFVTSGCDCIPIDRNSASVDWIHTCIGQLNSGSSVMIFPEGTTFKEKNVDKFKSGFVLLAKMANVKVLPVSINGNYKPFTRGKLKIKIGTPTKLDIKEFTSDAMESECYRFQQIVNKMYNEFSLDDDQSTKKIVEV